MSFKQYVWKYLRNKGLGLLDGCDELHIGRGRLDRPETFKISEFKRIRDTLDIPDREMEQKIVEIYRYGEIGRER